MILSNRNEKKKIIMSEKESVLSSLSNDVPCDYCESEGPMMNRDDVYYDICVECYEELEECAKVGEHFKGLDFLVCRDCLSLLEAGRGSDDVSFQCEPCGVIICEDCWEKAVVETAGGGDEGSKAWKREKKRLEKTREDFIECFQCKK